MRPHAERQLSNPLLRGRPWEPGDDRKVGSGGEAGVTDLGSISTVDQKVRNLLYREPRLYDLMFSDETGTVPKMCREAFARYLPSDPRLRQLY